MQSNVSLKLPLEIKFKKGKKKVRKGRRKEEKGWEKVKKKEAEKGRDLL